MSSMVDLHHIVPLILRYCNYSRLGFTGSTRYYYDRSEDGAVKKPD